MSPGHPYPGVTPFVLDEPTAAMDMETRQAFWAGMTAFAALAVAIGHRFTPDRVQPVAMFVYFVMSILGGLWFALAGWRQKVGQRCPPTRSPGPARA